MNYDVAMVRPPVDFSLKVGGQEMRKYVREFTLRRPWNGQASLEVTFTSYGIDLLQDNPSSFGFKHHKKPNTGTVPRAEDIITLEIYSAGVSSAGKTPTFLGGGWACTSNVTGRWVVYDFTYLLDVENQYMPDITPSQNQFVGTAISQIASKFGVRSTDLRILNHRVHSYRRDRGNPRTWIGTLGKASQPCMRFRGSTLVMESAPKVPAKLWNYTAGRTIQSIQWRESEPPPKNKFVCNRLDPQKGIVGEKSCKGGQCVGRTVDIAVSPPTSYITAKLEVTEGVIDDWVWEDVDGQLHVTGPTGVYTGPAAISRVRATYVPNLYVSVGNTGALSYTPSYDISLFGSQPGDSRATSYKAEYTHAPSVAEYGLWPDFQNIEDAMIPDQTTAQYYVEAVTWESVRKTLIGSIDTPFVNPDIEPGDWVHVDAEVYGKSRWFSDDWFVDTVVTKMANGGKDWSETLSISQGVS